MHLRLVAGLCLLALSTPSTPAQAVWTKRWAQALPTSGSDMPMAFDSGRGKTVLFGSGGKPETWEYDGKSWQRVAITGPKGSYDDLAVYHAAIGRVILLSCAPTSQIVETWSWDGVKWTQLTTGNRPPSRRGFRLAYDSLRKVTVLFGGVFGSNELADTWEFDGSDWQQRSSGGPVPRADMAMAFDEARGEVVLFGGQASQRLGDTWVWDGRSWVEHFGIPGPTPRTYAAMAYDAKRARIVLQGGTDRTGTNYDETWEWDGKAWAQMNPVIKPTKGLLAVMVYDTVREVTIFHGTNGQGTETWEYTNRPLPEASYASFGTGCAGSVGAPVLAAGPGQLPKLGQSFQVELTGLPTGSFVRAFGLLGVSNTTWNGLPLPLALGPVGMPGCDLLVGMDIMLGLSIVNGKAIWAFQVPNDPSLAGDRFYLQGLVFEPGVNPFGALSSNGGAGRLGM